MSLDKAKPKKFWWSRRVLRLNKREKKKGLNWKQYFFDRSKYCREGSPSIGPPKHVNPLAERSMCFKTTLFINWTVGTSTESLQSLASTLSSFEGKGKWEKFLFKPPQNLLYLKLTLLDWLLREVLKCSGNVIWWEIRSSVSSGCFI